MTVVAVHATQVPYKSCASFTNCITKIDRTTIDDAEDLDFAMPIFNLLEYSSNYSDTTSKVIYGFILKIKQLVLIMILWILMISNFSSIRPNYWETQ